MLATRITFMTIVKRVLNILCLLIFSYACSYGTSPSPRVIEFDESTGNWPKVPKGGGIYKVGKPYEVDGQSFIPKEYKRYSSVGTASWYGSKFHGRYTANGEIYDMNGLSAAHPVLQMPSLVRVTNLENNRKLVVRVNDRGPFKKDREIDLSRAAAGLLGFKEKGTAKVKVDYLGPASLQNTENLERQINKKSRKNKYAGLNARNRQKTRDSSSENPLKISNFKRFLYGQNNNNKSDSLSRAVNGYYIQIGAFEDKNNINRIMDDLDGYAYGVRIDPVQVKGKTLHRIRLGPIASSNEAMVSLNNAHRLGWGEARLVVVSKR